MHLDTIKYMEEKLVLSSKQKALKINLDNSIYGSMVEIGDETRGCRQFFKQVLILGQFKNYVSMIKIFQMQLWKRKRWQICL